jgi:HK97 gp10 family phage protein
MSKGPKVVYGEAELLRKLRKIPRATAGEILQHAVRAALEPIAKRARANAPKGETEELSSSIGIVWKRTGEQWFVAGVGIDDSGKPADLQRAHVMRFQEFGTVNHPAHPFLRPPFYNSSRAARKLVIDDIRTRVLTAAR